MGIYNMLSSFYFILSAPILNCEGDFDLLLHLFDLESTSDIAIEIVSGDFCKFSLILKEKSPVQSE